LFDKESNNATALDGAASLMMISGCSIYRDSVYTLAQIACQFRMAHAGGQNCSLLFCKRQGWLGHAISVSVEMAL